MPEMSASPSPLPQELPRGAELVIAARCAPLSCRSFAARYARGRPVVLCCPRHEEDALLSARIAHALRELRPSGLRVVRMWLAFPSCLNAFRLKRVRLCLLSFPP